MKELLKTIPIYFVVVFLSYSCNAPKVETIATASHVEIGLINDAFHFFVNNKPFYVQGVGMGGIGDDSRIQLLKEIGGNSIRTWNAKNAQQILDSAAKYDLMVAIGLEMGKELHGFDYEDSAAVQEQFEQMKSAVDKYKNHPNLLCWVPGNELNLFFGEDGSLIPVNPKTYLALNAIVNYIHEVDPHHPVTTTFAGPGKPSIDYALKYCPNLDFLSFQVYGTLGEVPSQVVAQGITMPYLITEYGPVGHWERPATDWGREIEETSNEKAIGLAERMQQAFTNDTSGLNMGGYAFLWGQKQERTPTWYGMFNKSGEATAVVDELCKLWTGTYPANRAPQLDSIKLDDQNSVDNIYLKPNSQYSADVFASDPNNDQLTYKWVIMKEVVERSQGGSFEKEPENIPFEVIKNANGSLTFISPTEEGDYRLFSYIYDENGKAGNANVPFFVKGGK